MVYSVIFRRRFPTADDYCRVSDPGGRQHRHALRGSNAECLVHSDVLTIRTGEETMPDENESNSVLSRRTFNKGAIASGAAALGIAGFSGSAAAQQNAKNLQLGDVTQNSSGLLSIQVQNVNVLQDVNVEDITVTVIGGDANIIRNVDVNIEDMINDRVINVENVNILNDSVVQVAVAALSDTGDVVAAGSTVESF